MALIKIIRQYCTAVSQGGGRVKDGMSLRNGMWHGLRNDLIMRNVKYEKCRKGIN